MASLPIKADEFFTAWSRKQWKPVYLFAGSEDLLIEQALHKIRDDKLASDPSGINQERLDGEKKSAEEILQACRTMPFLGTCRLVEVENTGYLAPAEQARLATGIAHLPDTAQLILLWGKDWRRDDLKKTLVNAVIESGDLVIFWPLYPEQAQRWAIQQAKTHQKTLNPDAAAWLVQEAGERLRGLQQELAKAAAYVGGRPTITLEDVQASFGYPKASSPFTWVAALRQKKSTTALDLLERLLSEGEEPIKLLALISGSMRDWLTVKDSLDNTQAISLRLRLKRGEEGKVIQELRKLSEEDLVEGLSACIDAQQTIKSGKETPAMALTLLTLRLCGLETAHFGR